jgi:PadR family transcriptional regulator PadR
MQLSKDFITNKQSQIKKGLLEFLVLLIVGRREVYASEIIEELKKLNLIVVEGTLYPLLSRIKKNNLIEYRWVESKLGPPRKYYIITDKGKKLLSSLTETWNQLESSINNLKEKYEKNN